MKRVVAFLCAALMLPAFLTSCGSSTTDEGSRVELTDKGKIIEYTVEDFSGSNYDADELSDFVDEAVSDYRQDHKRRSVLVNTERVRNEVAYLTMTYSDAETYAEFNRVDCFSGTAAEALAKGYSFSMNFYAVEPEETTGVEEENLSAEEENPEISAEVEELVGEIEELDEDVEAEVEAEEDAEMGEDTETDEDAETEEDSGMVSGNLAIREDGLRLFIVASDVDVIVPGTIRYYYSSFGTIELASENTVHVALEEEIVGQPNLVYILYTEEEADTSDKE